MGKIALSQNTSLDGVMQSPGPMDVPFKYRGWAVDFDFNYEEEVGLEQAQNCEALLLGRVTYEASTPSGPQRKVSSRQAERVAEVRRLPNAHRPAVECDRPGRRLAGGSGATAKGAGRRDRRLWQPSTVAGFDRNGARGRAAPTCLPRWCSVLEIACSARPRTRSRCAGRIASVRGRSGEHDLRTRNGGRVMRTLGIHCASRFA
jgi:hypothetical protein